MVVEQAAGPAQGRSPARVIGLPPPGGLARPGVEAVARTIARRAFHDARPVGATVLRGSGAARIAGVPCRGRKAMPAERVPGH